MTEFFTKTARLVYSDEMIASLVADMDEITRDNPIEKKLCFEMLGDVLNYGHTNAVLSAHHISKLSARVNSVFGMRGEERTNLSSFNHSIEKLWNKAIDEMLNNSQTDEAVVVARDAACLAHQSSFMQSLASNTWYKLVSDVAAVDLEKAQGMVAAGHAFRDEMKLDVIFGRRLDKATNMFGITDVGAVTIFEAYGAYDLTDSTKESDLLRGACVFEGEYFLYPADSQKPAAGRYVEIKPNESCGQNRIEARSAHASGRVVVVRPSGFSKVYVSKQCKP